MKTVNNPAAEFVKVNFWIKTGSIAGKKAIYES